MILIISHKLDFTADYVVNLLNEREIPYRRLNCEDLLAQEISLTVDQEFSYSILGQQNFDAIWFRRTKLPDLPGLTLPQKSYVLGEVDTLLKNLFAAIPGRWLSPPFFVYRAENKLLQLKTARELNFTTPDTLISNSKDQVKAFFEKHKGKIVLKPLCQTKLLNGDNSSFLFTNVVSEEMIKRLYEFDLTPSIFQEHVPKQYELRVTVVAGEVYSAKVDSQQSNETAIDWRRKSLVFEKTTLPSHIENLCVKLTQELGLAFGAIDLIVRPDGEYIFLEINPNGQWVWIETQTQQPISEAIISYLTNGKGDPNGKTH